MAYVDVGVGSSVVELAQDRLEFGHRDEAILVRVGCAKKVEVILARNPPAHLGPVLHRSCLFTPHQYNEFIYRECKDQLTSSYLLNSRFTSIKN